MLVPGCVQGEQGGKSYSLSGLLVGRSSQDTACFDDAKGYRYAKGIHVVPYANGAVAFRLPCDDPGEELAFFRDNAKSDRFALLLGDRVITTYHRASGDDGECGLFGAEGIESALAVCEAVASELSVPAEGCFELCKNGKEGLVCVENKPGK